VRACFSGSPRSYNFEVKCIDGTANPYIALSAILAAGMTGVKSGSALNMKACQGRPVKVYLTNVGESSKLTQGRRDEIGITKTLPRSLPDALALLQKDDTLQEALGIKFVESYISVKTVKPFSKILLITA